MLAIGLTIVPIHARGRGLENILGRYWEMYNVMDGDFEDMAISTFKVSLPTKHGLRKSLTGKPVTSVR